MDVVIGVGFDAERTQVMRTGGADKGEVLDVYITKDNGDIVFSTDGKELTVTKQRG